MPYMKILTILKYPAYNKFVDNFGVDRQYTARTDSSSF